MWKKCKVVLLPTKESDIVKCNCPIHNGQLLYKKGNFTSQEEIAAYEPQHLYIISPDEEIKENEYYIAANMVFLSDSKYNSDDSNNPNGKGYCKVLATTDSSLITNYNGLSPISENWNKPLPQIPQSFIEEYISEYNKGNIIEDVEVEYELDMSLEEDAINFPILKIFKNNFISLRREEKRVYTREEVQQLINSFGDYHSINWLSQLTKDWLKHNNL